MPYALYDGKTHKLVEISDNKEYLEKINYPKKKKIVYITEYEEYYIIRKNIKN
jgi:hypothetical protein